MARYTGPSCRYCRAEKRKLFLKGERCSSAKCPINKKRPAPGKDAKARAKKMSDYGIQLREKQKLKRIFGILEAQFRLFYARAAKKPGKTGDNLIILLESRLDSIVYRMHFASSRKQARQIISHGHVLVNGKRVTIASYIVRKGDVVEISASGKKMAVIKESLKALNQSGSFSWVDVDADALKGTVAAIPERADITDLEDIKENLIVELYSR